MKTWLFDILACPIDKNFPLRLYIFSYETPNEKIDLILDNFKDRALEKIKSENIIHLYQENGEILIQDDLVLEKTPLLKYLKKVKKSLEELDNIYDLSERVNIKTLLNYIRTDIHSKIEKSINNLPENGLDEILPELMLINKYKFDIEIETGILFCPECKRWFPIIDTIPQMLPDEYRNEKEELEFLKTNKNLLDEEFFHQNLKPFNL